jgi:terminase small subunit-like protein
MRPALGRVLNASNGARMSFTETETPRATETDATLATHLARACAQCQSTFTPKRQDARFCSSACRLKAHRAVKTTTAGSPAPAPSTKPRPGGRKLRRADPNKPKRPCPPTPVAEKPYVDPRRPALYTEEIAAEICFRLSHGETLTKICKDDHLPSRSTVLKWVNEDPDFGNRFARARDLQFEHWADSLVDTAAEVRTKPEEVPAARLDSENKRWLLARLKPSLYSEKFQADITSAGRPLSSATDLDIAKALAHVLAAPALAAPEPIEVQATEVKLEGEQ